MTSARLSQLRIVLIGRVGAGKTGLMNTILKSSVRYKEPAECPYTEQCHKETVVINNQEVVVVDTPGLCDAVKSDEEVMKEVKRGVSLASPGPHAFLFVLDNLPFTVELHNMVKLIWKTFGQNAAKYALVVLTHKSELLRGQRGPRNDDEIIKNIMKENPQLWEFVSDCEERYFAIENTDQDSSQVTELLKKINDMVQDNKGEDYTMQMFPKCQSKEKGLETTEKIKYAIYGCALVGAAGGFVASHFAGDVIPFGEKVLPLLGAVVGGVIGCVGIVAYEHIKAKICKI